MSSEYQRITSQLTHLQQQIFYNELPALLISYSQQQDPEKSVIQLITSLLAIQKQQFIAGIGKNIAHVKQEYQKLKIQNQEFRDLVTRQEVQLGRVKAGVQELMAEKNYLSSQLNQLKSHQQSLSKLINSPTIQPKIKQILSQTTQLKQQLQQRDSLLQQKQSQIKKYIEKQLYYTSEITALENDNTLFHRDLTSANFRVQSLGVEKLSLERILGEVREKVGVVQGEFGDMERRYKEEMVNMQGIIKQQKLKNQNLLQQIEKQVKFCSDIKQQANYLRGCLQKSQQDIQVLKQIEHNNKIRLIQSQEEIGGLKRLVDQIQIQYKNQVSELSRQLVELGNTSKQQISSLNDLLKKYTEKNTELQHEFEEYKAQSLKQQQQQEKLHGSVIQRLKKQLTEINIKQKQQLEEIIKDLEKKLKNVNGQLARLEDQIKIQKQNTQYYKIYLEENNQLRSQLDRINHSLRENQKNTASNANSRKYLFCILKICQEMQILKRDNINLRGLVITLIESTRKWSVKQINKMVCAIIDKKSQQESNLQWQKYQITKKNQIQQNKSSKDLKTLTQKYKQIKQQNMKSGNRIEQILKH